MPTSSPSAHKPPADIDKTSARRFPLVHQLIHFADLRHFYRDMREALITANRRAGAQQGLVTRARNRIAQLEAELTGLEQERDDLLSYRQRVEEEANLIAAVLPRIKDRLQQLQQIEQALVNLADIKEAVDHYERSHGGPTRQSQEDLRRAVERLLERVDAVGFFEDAVADIAAEIGDAGTSDTEAADER
jgi:chromosome segregation ATPase